MPHKWRTIQLPVETIDEIKENMKGFTSLSEFVRAAVRHYIDSRKIRPQLNDLEVPQIETVR